MQEELQEDGNGHHDPRSTSPDTSRLRLSPPSSSESSASSSPTRQPSALPPLGAESNPPTPKFIFVAGFFIIVATILGTGILGLPIKLARTGFGPFVFSYSITLIMQICTLVYTVELLQRVHAIQLRQMATGEAEHLALPDLHVLGKTLLPHPVLRVLFDTCVMLHFVSVLISYGLGGSQAYAKLLDLPYTAVIPIFIVFWTLVLVLGSRYIHSVITFFTMAKGSLLAVIVVITAIVAYHAQLHSASDWAYVGQPLLIGTVALGGGMNLLPVVYGKLTGFTRREMIWLLWACVLAISLVFILNVMWCYYILAVVPQTGEPISLQKAGENGEISTIPLMAIIEQNYPEFTWIAIAVDVFIMISLTVSFMTVGTGLKHTCDGLASAYAQWAHKKSMDEDLIRRSHSSVSLQRLLISPALFLRGLPLVWLEIGLYGIFFGLVFIVAVLNPKSFLIILERVTSLALNLESGMLVGLMLHLSRFGRPPAIPYPLPNYLFNFRWIMIGFFFFACIYNGVGGLAELLYN